MAYCTCDLNQFAYNALTANKDIKEVKFEGTDDIPAQDAYEVSLTRYGETTPLILLLDSHKIYFDGSLFKMDMDTYELVLKRKKPLEASKGPEVRENTKVPTEQYESSKKRAWVYVGIGIAGVALLMLLTRRCSTHLE